MGMFDAVVSGLLRKAEPIADAQGLADFMDSRAAFLAQKCVVEFCRVRAGVYWQKLFSEKEFQDALTTSRWLSYPPAFVMMAEMVEGVLREPAGIRQRRLPGVLVHLAGQVFSKYPVPAGAGEGFWNDAAQLVAERLDAPRRACRARCATFPTRRHGWCLMHCPCTRTSSPTITITFSTICG